MITKISCARALRLFCSTSLVVAAAACELISTVDADKSLDLDVDLAAATTTANSTKLYEAKSVQAE